ncbi:MAG: peptidyl-tRNA hydrolase [Corynebacterium nuruki]|nr:peptidyl-tRNA hydrolase [Corynebacterium nuruki]
MDELFAAAHTRLALLDDRSGRGSADAEDPSDPETVQAMPLVLEIPHDPLPDRRALLEAAARACVAVCLDPRAGEDPAVSPWAGALVRWYGARIRKVARRARNKKWRDVQEVPGVTVTVGTASARAFLPCPVHRTPPAVNKLQISGVDLAPDPSYAVETGYPEAVLRGDGDNGDDGHGAADPVIYVDGSLGMSVGKAAAQVCHGSMLLAAAMTVDAAAAWAERGFPLHVCEVDAARFAAVYAEARQLRAGSGQLSGRTAAVVQDAGYTEVAPGSVTVVAMTR